MPLPATALHYAQPRSADPAFPNGSANAGKYTLIFRIRHTETKRLLKQHSLILMPTTFTQETEVRSSVYYTKGGIVADVPTASGIGLTVFNIAGHTGYQGIPAEGGGAFLDRLSAPASLDNFLATVQVAGRNLGQGLPRRGSLLDGAAAIKDLQDTMRAYFFPPGQPETYGYASTQEVQLEFLNLSAPVSADDRTGLIGWVIHPHRNLVSIRQDASRPFLYFYTFQFAGIAPLDVVIEDPPIEARNTVQNLRSALRHASAVIRDLTNGVNTIHDAFQQLVIQNVTGPLSTLLLNTAQLTDAVQGFFDGVVDTIRFPLYAQRLVTHILDAPAHSVTTLRQAARELIAQLSFASLAKSLSAPFAAFMLTENTNDRLTVGINRETPVTLALGTQTSGTAIASTIQSQVRALTPAHTSNLDGYRQFTATYANGQYTLASGTRLSDAAHVNVVVDPDTALTPTDASAALGLGTLNGGQERPGTSVAVRAIALLQGLDEACTTLLSFPDYFASQLAAQDSALATHYAPETVRPQLRGDQHLTQVRITPGDSLQAIGTRVGVPWETLALVNGLAYPYIVLEPSTLLSGRLSSATRYGASDTHLSVTPNSLQGQRFDLLAGAGAGQSRIILRHTTTDYTLDHGWTMLPNDTTTYAIRQAVNPIVQTSTLSSTGAHSLDDSALHLVSDSQRGLTLWIASGVAAGTRRRIVENSQTGYLLDTAWEIVPAPGDMYLILQPSRSGQSRLLVLGDLVSVPHPSAQRGIGGVRTRLEDVSAITGLRLSQEEKLFGRDLLLEDGVLVWDPVQHDCRTIAGRASLRQGVIHLVNVPLGQIEYNAGLGSYLHEELGQMATLPGQTQLLHSIERSIKQDARIAKLAGAEVFTEGGKTLVSLAVVAVSGDTIDRVVIR